MGANDKMTGMKAALIAVTLIALVGCVGAEVTPIGPARPGLPLDCNVTVLPGRQPDFPIVDVASARAWCEAPSGRADCIDELRRRACGVGGDVVYGFSESVERGVTYISATLAYRDTARPPHPAPVAAAPAVPVPGECEPPCSPGFACKAGTCIPQCNPPCEAGEICSRRRSCEPADAGPAPAAPAPAHP